MIDQYTIIGIVTLIIGIILYLIPIRMLFKSIMNDIEKRKGGTENVNRNK